MLKMSLLTATVAMQANIKAKAMFIDQGQTRFFEFMYLHVIQTQSFY